MLQGFAYLQSVLFHLRLECGNFTAHDGGMTSLTGGLDLKICWAPARGAIASGRLLR